MTEKGCFFERHAELEPEEATSLGLHGREHELRDMSAAGEERRRALRDETLSDITDAQDLDARVLRRMLTIERHLDERGDQRANPQWATYPYTMSRYLAAHRGDGEPALLDAQGPYQARAAALPGYLAEHRKQLREEAARGRIAHRAFLESLCEHELPAARDFFAGIDETAARACGEHAAFLRDELLPRAPVTALLGAEEYAERLQLFYRIDRPLGELVAEARAALHETQTEMISAARKIAAGTTISDFADVARLMQELQSETLPEGHDLDAHYRGIMRRVMARLVELGEFEALDVDELGMDEYPEGMRDQGPGTNWPAPILDASGRGQFVIHPDPAAHSRAWAGVLAVHEGLPGHYLQSREFRRHFAGTNTPLRFLCVADDVAIPRLNFGAMLGIEGWAVYAEQLCRRAGLQQGSDALFALAAHALRALRVIAEIELHRGALAPDEIEMLVVENAGLPSAKWELQRYQRGPLQAVAYFFGAREIGELRRRIEAARGASFRARDFHAQLLACGPVLPAEAAPFIG